MAKHPVVTIKSSRKNEQSPVSQLRVDLQKPNARITIWNRGGLAGTISVDHHDVQSVVDRLLPEGERLPEVTSLRLGDLVMTPAPSEAQIRQRLGG